MACGDGVPVHPLIFMLSIAICMHMSITPCLGRSSSIGDSRPTLHFPAVARLESPAAHRRIPAAIRDGAATYDQLRIPGRRVGLSGKNDLRHLRKHQLSRGGNWSRALDVPAHHRAISAGHSCVQVKRRAGIGHSPDQRYDLKRLLQL
eukprot:scaffold2006_cov141-Isochrysis_galbana.AAC.8